VIKSSIVLIGMMGSGKTTVGKILAREIKYNFIDTDQLIEDQENKTCKQILTENGETFFRYLELNLLSSIDYENTVIATGGGLPIFNNNIEILLKKSLVIYIKTSIEDLAKRLKNDNKRAISKEISSLKKILNNRKKTYDLAHQTILTKNKTVNEIVKEIKSLIF